MKKPYFSDKEIDAIEKELLKPDLFRCRVVYYYRRITKPPYTKLEKRKFYCYTDTEQQGKIKELRQLGYNDFVCHLLGRHRKPPWLKE
jgi:hypothetical protein